MRAYHVLVATILAIATLPVSAHSQLVPRLRTRLNHRLGAVLTRGGRVFIYDLQTAP
jgi:hypothetical protein